MNSKKVLLFAVIALGSVFLGFSLLGLQTPNPANEQAVLGSSVAQNPEFQMPDLAKYQTSYRDHEREEHEGSDRYSDHLEYEHDDD